MLRWDPRAWLEWQLVDDRRDLQGQPAAAAAEDAFALYAVAVVDAVADRADVARKAVDGAQGQAAEVRPDPVDAVEGKRLGRGQFVAGTWPGRLVPQPARASTTSRIGRQRRAAPAARRRPAGNPLLITVIIRAVPRGDTATSGPPTGLSRHVSAIPAEVPRSGGVAHRASGNSSLVEPQGAESTTAGLTLQAAVAAPAAAEWPLGGSAAGGRRGRRAPAARRRPRPGRRGLETRRAGSRRAARTADGDLADRRSADTRHGGGQLPREPVRQPRLQRARRELVWRPRPTRVQPAVPAARGVCSGLKALAGPVGARLDACCSAPGEVAVRERGGAGERRCFALAAVGDVWLGRIAFAFGVTFALGAGWRCAAATRCGGGAGDAVCGGQSGGGAAAGAGRPHGRPPPARAAARAGAGLPAARCRAALALLFPEGGCEPFPLSRSWPRRRSCRLPVWRCRARRGRCGSGGSCTWRPAWAACSCTRRWAATSSAMRSCWPRRCCCARAGERERALRAAWARARR